MPAKGAGKRPHLYALTEYEKRAVKLADAGLTKAELRGFGVDRALNTARQKLRLAALVEADSEHSGRGSSLSVARGAKRMKGTR